MLLLASRHQTYSINGTNYKQASNQRETRTRNQIITYIYIKQEHKINECSTILNCSSNYLLVFLTSSMPYTWHKKRTMGCVTQMNKSCDCRLMWLRWSKGQYCNYNTQHERTEWRKWYTKLWFRSRGPHLNSISAVNRQPDPNPLPQIGRVANATQIGRTKITSTSAHIRKVGSTRPGFLCPAKLMRLEVHW